MTITRKPINLNYSKTRNFIGGNKENDIRYANLNRTQSANNFLRKENSFENLKIQELGVSYNQREYLKKLGGNRGDNYEWDLDEKIAKRLKFF